MSMRAFVIGIVAVVAAIMASPTRCAAVTIDPKLAKSDDACGRFQVIHINGVQTSSADARENTVALGTAYGNAHNEKLIRYITAYNPTQGGLLDVVDALQAKTTEYPGATYVMLLRAMLFNQVTAPVTQALAAELQKLLIDRIRLTGYKAHNNADLETILASIRLHGPATNRSLLVPHSEGNLYANSVYAALTSATQPPGRVPTPAKSIAILGVASPASYVAGNGKYVTSRQDTVIAGLRMVESGVLASNVSVPFTVNDWMGHNFIKIYLKQGSEARSKILSEMKIALDGLRLMNDVPTPTLFASGGGGLSATWQNILPDVGQSCVRPRIFQGQLQQAPFLSWWVAKSNRSDGIAEVRPGQATEVEALARQQAQDCYDMALAAARADLAEVGYIKNQGVGCLHQSSKSGAWLTYSHDWQEQWYEQQQTLCVRQNVEVPDVVEGRSIVRGRCRA